MVMVLLAQAAVTPAGKPVAVPMPVAFAVVWVILVNAELTHKVGVLDAAPAVAAAVTVAVIAVLLAEVQVPLVVLT
jgi:hypothetical protein